MNTIPHYNGENIKEGGRSALFNYKMGMYSLKINSYEDAINYFTDAYRLDKINPKYLYQLGITYFSLHQNDKAIHYLRKACELDKANKEFYTEFSKFYNGKQEISKDEALIEIAQMLDKHQANKSDPAFKNILGDHYAKHGGYRAAINFYKEAISFVKDEHNFKVYEQIKAKVLKCIAKLDASGRSDYLTKFLLSSIDVLKTLEKDKNAETVLTAKKLIIEIRSEIINVQQQTIFNVYLEEDNIEALSEIVEKNPQYFHGLSIDAHLALAKYYELKDNPQMAGKFYKEAALNSKGKNATEKIDDSKGLTPSKSVKDLSIDVPRGTENHNITMISPSATPHGSPKNSFFTLGESSEDEATTPGKMTPRNSFSKTSFSELAPMSPYVRHSHSIVTTVYKSTPSNKSTHDMTFAKNKAIGDLLSLSAPMTPQSSFSKTSDESFSMSSSVKQDFSTATTPRHGTTVENNSYIQKAFAAEYNKQLGFTPRGSAWSHTSQHNTPEKSKLKTLDQELSTPGGRLYFSDMYTPRSHNSSKNTYKSQETPISISRKEFNYGDEAVSMSPFASPPGTPRSKASSDETSNYGNKIPTDKSHSKSSSDTPLSTPRNKTLAEVFTTKFHFNKSDHDKHSGTKSDSLQVPTKQEISKQSIIKQNTIKEIAPKQEIVISPPPSPKNDAIKPLHQDIPHEPILECGFGLVGESSGFMVPLP